MAIFELQDGKKIENYHLIKPSPSGQKRSHLAMELTGSVANSLQNFSASAEEKIEASANDDG
jgi:hypothetical protein